MNTLQKAKAQEHIFSNRMLFALIFPLVLESALNMLIGMADTMMVASCGEASVSAVSLIDSISNLLISLLSAFATGGAVVCSQYLGAKNSDKAKATAKNLVYLSAGIGLLCLAVILPTRLFIIDHVFGSVEPELRAYANDYFFFITLSYPFLAIYSALTAICRSEGKSSRTLYVAIVMNILNIVGNAALIFIFKLGPKGAAISSLVSRIFGASALFLLLSKKDEKLSLNGITRDKIDLSLIKRIAMLGIPSGIEGSFFHVGKISVLSMVSALGTSAVAINAVIGNFNMYANIPGNAINLAIITVVGQARGKDDFEEINYYKNKLLAVCFASTLLVCIPCFIFAKEMISLYNLQAENAAAALWIARRCLIACCIIWPTSFSTPNVLKAVGDVRFVMVSALLSMWALRVLGAFFFINILKLGVEGVWFAMYLDWLFRSFIFEARYKRGKWKAVKVID